jgi:hypothetical protein
MQDPKCPGCSGELTSTVYVLISLQLFKSCALCSRVAGEHVYHAIDDFGVWHQGVRSAAIMPQTECVAAFRARATSTSRKLSELPAGDGLREALPSLPAHGPRCRADQAHGKPVRSDDARVAHALASLRPAAEARLATDRGPGRRAPQVYGVEREVAAEPRPAAVLRRRAGVILTSLFGLLAFSGCERHHQTVLWHAHPLACGWVQHADTAVALCVGGGQSYLCIEVDDDEPVECAPIGPLAAEACK